jgi:hypothetical protein
VFEARLGTFVREALQNSTDAQLDPDRPVQLRLVVDPVSGDRLEAMQEAIGWPALQAHLEGAAKGAGGTEGRRFARATETEPEAIVNLWIEDCGTTGLDGPESGGGRFAALCRDRLFSDKHDVRAGGSFGLGKAVLWRFSRWSTVVFYSRPAYRSPSGLHRLIVKAALPWHTLGPDEFSGEGWFGRPQPAPGGGQRAESAWDEDALGILEALGRPPLPDGATGTRIGVIGFEDPAREVASDPDALAVELYAAAERDFWPAVARGRLTLEVAVGRDVLAPPPSTAPWRRMLEVYDARGERAALQAAGDVVVREVRFTLPKHRATREGPTDVGVDLVVRASPGGEDGLYELIAFRGAGMVVQRSDERRLASTVRPFHAMVVAGRARRGAGPADALLDAFLRDAEPPSHDRWTRTGRLRDDWSLGYGKALEALAAGVREALRSVVAPVAGAVQDGPVGLRSLFPLPGPGGGEPSESVFRFTSLSARLDPDLRWQFEGIVAPVVALTGPWTVRVDARFPEDGGPGTRRMVGEIRTTVGTARVDDGLAVIEAPAGTAQVRFEGSTDPTRYPLDPHRASLELVVYGAETG